MRGIVPGLVTPSPLLTRLPGVMQDDPFLARFLPAFDNALAPAISTLDNLAAYLDPSLAPEDFLAWLAAWVAVEPDAAWSAAQRRAFVRGAAALHRRAGTVRGIREAVRLAVGPDAVVEVNESGGASWSTKPGSRLPGSDSVRVEVRVTGADDPDVRRRVERLLRAFVPAHVPWTLAASHSPRSAKDAAPPLPTTTAKDAVELRAKERDDEDRTSDDPAPTQDAAPGQPPDEGRTP